MAATIRFRDLNVGDTFDFIKGNGMDSFYERCTKVSARAYQWRHPQHKYLLKSKVGTINVEVFHVERKPVPTAGSPEVWEGLGM